MVMGQRWLDQSGSPEYGRSCTRRSDECVGCRAVVGGSNRHDETLGSSPKPTRKPGYSSIPTPPSGSERRATETPRRQVVLATAHPAKFPDTVEEATGRWPTFPHLDDLYDLDEQYSIVPNELGAVARAMTSTLGVRSHQ